MFLRNKKLDKTPFVPAEAVGEIMQAYIKMQVEQGNVEYIIRNPKKLMVKIPDTTYFWGPDRAKAYHFCWHGEHAFYGELPKELGERFPDWKFAERFSASYIFLMQSKDWSTEQRKAYEFSNRTFERFERIRILALSGKWSEARAEYEKEQDPVFG